MFNLPASKTIFFSDKGLTPASAGHIANLAKEYYKRHERMHQTMSLTNKSIRLLSGESAQISKAISAQDFSQIPQLIDRIAKAKALIAWLREAIKAREALIELVRSQEYQESLEVEGAHECVEPEKPVSMEQWGNFSQIIDDRSQSDDWGYDLWHDDEKRTIRHLEDDEKIEYTIVKSIAQDLENACHYGGDYAKKVADANYVKSHPVVKADIYSTIYRAVCVPEEVINEGWYRLRKLVEKYQYNGPAERIRKEAEDREAEMALDYNKAQREYFSQLRRLRSQQRIKASEILQKVRNLRIIVPESLQSIYQEITALGQD